MTNCAVLVATENRIEDWVEVYNQSHRSRPEHVPLDEREVRTLLKKEKMKIRNMLLAYHGRIPVAACRTGPDTRPGLPVFISDLSVIPGDHNGGESLVAHVVERARDNGSPLFSMWIGEDVHGQAGIAAAFSLDVLDVRSRMEHVMLERPDVECSDMVSAISRFSACPPLDESLLGGQLGLRESIEITGDHWKPALQVALGDDSGMIVAYTSNAARNQGWLMIQNHNTAPLPASIGRRELLAALAAMFDVGIRRIRTEIYPEDSLKRLFSDEGFQARSTFYLMGLELLY